MRTGYAYAIATALVLAGTTLWPAQAAACGTTPAAKPQYMHRARPAAARLGVPAGNAQGIDFEPWHWRYAGPPPADEGLLAETPSTHVGAMPAGVSTRTYPIVQGYP